MDKKDIIFAPNVLLLDAAFLNGTVRDIKLLMGNKLGRELPDTDLVDWLICLALDGGLRGESNELQVLWVADEGVRQMPGKKSGCGKSACSPFRIRPCMRRFR